MKRVCISPNIVYSDYNTSNLHENDPYIVDENGVLIIDEQWWNNEVPEIGKKLIKERVSFVLGKVETPHEVGLDMELVHVYQAYQEAFEFQHWYSKDLFTEDVFVIKLTKQMKELLATKDRNSFLLQHLQEEIKSYIDKSKYNKWFVKTGCTSGKNESYLTPLKDEKDIVERLLSVDEFSFRDFNNTNKDTYIIIKSWNERINRRNEFRLFVVNRKVTAMSPQKFAECHNYTEEELDIIENAVLESFQMKDSGSHAVRTQNAKLLQMSPYETFVADVYVDFESDDKQCHLIEFNCFGDHSGAGSSLFNWEKDRDVLYGKSQPEFRFISLINMYP